MNTAARIAAAAVAAILSVGPAVADTSAPSTLLWDCAHTGAPSLGQVKQLFDEANNHYASLLRARLQMRLRKGCRPGAVRRRTPGPGQPGLCGPDRAEPRTLERQNERRHRAGVRPPATGRGRLKKRDRFRLVTCPARVVMMGRRLAGAESLSAAALPHPRTP